MLTSAFTLKHAFFNKRCNKLKKSIRWKGQAACQHAYYEPTIRPFQQPKQRRAQLQPRQFAGLNMTKHSHTTMIWQHRSFYPLYPWTHHYGAQRKTWSWRGDTRRASLCKPWHEMKWRHKKQRRERKKSSPHTQWRRGRLVFEAEEMERFKGRELETAEWSRVC